MESSEYKVTLDIHATSSPVSLAVKQGDTGRRLCATLMANGSPYKIAAGCYAVLSGKKPDGKILWNECGIEGDTIVYDFTEQTVNVVGLVLAQLRLYGAGGKLICAPDFTLIVDAPVTRDSEVVAVSEDEVTALTSLVTEATALIDSVEQKLENGEFVGPQGPQGESATVDPTLTQDGQAADAKVAGERIGNLADLGTEDKSSLVAALNELVADMLPYPENVSTGTYLLVTAAEGGRIKRIECVGNPAASANEKTAKNAAAIGDLAALETEDQSSLVAAVNEVLEKSEGDHSQNADYTLPVATAETLGGVKPVTATADMTQPVGVDANGLLYTDAYNRSEINTIMGAYITDIDALVGG